MTTFGAVVRGLLPTAFGEALEKAEELLNESGYSAETPVRDIPDNVLYRKFARKVVKPQIDLFKKKQFGDDVFAPCEMCGGMIHWCEVNAHHKDPPFWRIYEQWRDRNKDRSAVEAARDLYDQHTEQANLAFLCLVCHDINSLGSVSARNGDYHLKVVRSTVIYFANRVAFMDIEGQEHIIPFSQIVAFKLDEPEDDGVFGADDAELFEPDEKLVGKPAFFVVSRFIAEVKNLETADPCLDVWARDLVPLHTAEPCPDARNTVEGETMQQEKLKLIDHLKQKSLELAAEQAALPDPEQGDNGKKRKKHKYNNWPREFQTEMVTRVKKEMDEKKISMKEISDRSGISTSSVSSFLKNENGLSAAVITSICCYVLGQDSIYWVQQKEVLTALGYYSESAAERENRLLRERIAEMEAHRAAMEERLSKMEKLLLAR